MKYSLIYADPAWEYGNTISNGAATILSLMPDGEWISWRGVRFKGVNRPHFRFVRLWRAGFIQWGIPSETEETPYNAVQVRKLKGEPTCV